MNSVTNDLMKDGYLRSEKVIEAFSAIERIEFVPSKFELQADANVPFPIGYGQSISQLTTVALMLELLDAGSGHNVLDIGSGSGWTTALLAHIVGENGRVTGVENIAEIFEFGKKNISKFGFIENGVVELYNEDGSLGFEKNAPYDRILVSASVDEVPESLEKQLKTGGKMVIPIHNRLCYLRKDGENDFYKEEYPGFSFVPLMQKGNK